MRKYILRIIFLAVCLIMFGITVQAQNPEPSLADKLSYTMADVQAYIPKVIPVIEETTGRKFKSIPEIKIVESNQLYDTLLAEAMIQFKNLYPGFSNAQIKSMAIQQSMIASSGILGKYGVLDKKLYLVPENLAPTLVAVKVNPNYGPAITQLIITHELVHALQDQETDLDNFFTMSSLDEMNAYMATIEGHAMMVQDIVAQKLGYDKAAIEIARIVSAGAVTSDDPASEMINKIIATQYEQIYLGGKKFIEFFNKKGGNENVWKVLAEPPVKTSMIANPDTYSPVKAEDLNIASLFKNLERDLDGSGWKAQDLELGEMMIRSAYAKMPASEQDLIIRNITQVHVYIAQNQKKQQLFTISAFVLKDKAFVGTYLSLVEKMAEQNVKELETSKIFKIRDLKIEDFNKIYADKARKISFTIIPANQNEGIEQFVLRIARDNLLLEFALANYELDESEIVRIALKIFARYEKLNQSKNAL